MPAAVVDVPFVRLSMAANGVIYQICVRRDILYRSSPRHRAERFGARRHGAAGSQFGVRRSVRIRTSNRFDRPQVADAPSIERCSVALPSRRRNHRRCSRCRSSPSRPVAVSAVPLASHSAARSRTHRRFTDGAASLKRTVVSVCEAMPPIVSVGVGRDAQRSLASFGGSAVGDDGVRLRYRPAARK